MTDPVLRLKDIDIHAFALLALDRVGKHPEAKVRATAQKGRIGVMTLARAVAILARDRKWTLPQTTCDLGLIYLAQLTNAAPAAPGSAIFTTLCADAPLTGRCNDLFAFVMSCAAVVVATERRDDIPDERLMDLTSRTREEIESLVAAGEGDRVLEWSVVPSFGTA